MSYSDTAKKLARKHYYLGCFQYCYNCKSKEDILNIMGPKGKLTDPYYGIMLCKECSDKYMDDIRAIWEEEYPTILLSDICRCHKGEYLGPFKVERGDLSIEDNWFAIRYKSIMKIRGTWYLPDLEHYNDNDTVSYKNVPIRSLEELNINLEWNIPDCIQ